MRLGFRSLILVALINLACACGTGVSGANTAAGATARAKRSAPVTRTPVVVELFTSEGCSDCPPADALLKELETRQPIPGIEVVAIEEHVDYWNHDGWIDPFSSARWTVRQQEYDSKLKAGAEYTPQMVVDGTTAFVGSNARAAVAAITRAAREPQTKISITAGTPDGNDAQECSVTVGILAGAKTGDPMAVWLAVTENGLHSSVSAGENAGRVLYHAAVLRWLKKIGDARGEGATSFRGMERVKIPRHWKRKNLHLVVFVQDQRSLKILGAAETRVSAER